MLLFAHGDVRQPLPETVRVLDEILTDFMQSIAFEAARAAHYSGRQKIKYSDFEFSFRKNPMYLGKLQEVFEKQDEIKKIRALVKDNDGDIMKEAAEEEKRVEKEGGKGRKRPREEELGEGDDDEAADADIGKRSKV